MSKEQMKSWPTNIQVMSSNVEYAGSYFKDLFAFKSRGVENGHAALLKQFSLPFRFVLIPHVLFAVASYGVFLGG
jgi:hypothetical protein